MRDLVLAAALTVATAAPAAATTVKLDMNQVVGVLTSLGRLEGYKKTETVDGKPVEVSVAYQLGGLVRLSLANDSAKLNAALTSFKTARQAMAAETKGADVKDSSEANRLNAETNKLALVKYEYDLELIKSSDLKLDVNPIPVDVLTGLVPILAP